MAADGMSPATTTQVAGMLRDGRLKADPLGITAVVPVVLAFLLVVEGLRVLARGRRSGGGGESTDGGGVGGRHEVA